MDQTPHDEIRQSDHALQIHTLHTGFCYIHSRICDSIGMTRERLCKQSTDFAVFYTVDLYNPRRHQHTGSLKNLWNFDTRIDVCVLAHTYVYFSCENFFTVYQYVNKNMMMMMMMTTMIFSHAHAQKSEISTSGQNCKASIRRRFAVFLVLIAHACAEVTESTAYFRPRFVRS